MDSCVLVAGWKLLGWELMWLSELDVGWLSLRSEVGCCVAECFL